MGILIPAVTEEITNGYLHRGPLLTIPVDTEDQIPPNVLFLYLTHGHPNMVHRAAAFNIRNGSDRAARQSKIGIQLPALAQIPGGLCAAATDCHAAFSLISREILGSDGPALGARQAVKGLHGIMNSGNH